MGEGEGLVSSSLGGVNKVQRIFFPLLESLRVGEFLGTHSLSLRD